ncbi:hypothetical protein G7061_06975 [Erysipelothrix sp. HDW6B]|uniref:hypothetical protein n=1 Tax=Erysipelothrix sp. HDW6B TaxID=2714929 RepID=UPI0014079C9D|nr:hypothetical protein [Erysipelothrix sp. HDW6B]QIK86365.1 hypothetical protein G7061_06975 [Erysipelothrix sp. HDW6B]
MDHKIYVGKILEFEKEYRFEYMDGLLSVFENIGVETQEKLNSTKNFELLDGQTDRDEFLKFVDVSKISNSIEKGKLIEKYKVGAVIYSKEKILEQHEFDAVKFIGGSLDSFGDPVLESFESSLTNYNEIDRFGREGVVDIKTKPYSETDINFTLPSSDGDITCILGINRHALIHKNVFEEWNRYFIYRKESTFTALDIQGIFSNVYSFVRIITMSKNIGFDKILLCKKNEEGLLERKAILFVPGLWKKDYKKCNNLKIDDFRDEINSIGKLFEISEELDRLHMFMQLDSNYRSFSVNEVLNAIINFEQLTSKFEIESGVIKPEIEQAIEKITKEYSGEGMSKYRSLVHHIKYFKPRTSDAIARKFIEKHPLIEEQLYLITMIPEDERSLTNLSKFFEYIRDFRNKIVHSGEYGEFSDKLGLATRAIIYLNYTIIYREAGYSESQTVKLVNKYMML